MNKIFYFIFFYGDDPNAKFNIHNANAIISNMVINSPDSVELHTDNTSRLYLEPAYIEMLNIIKSYESTKHLNFTVVYHNKSEFETINGTPIPYMAHRSDLLRLQLLERVGGVYCDLDCIALHPMPRSWFDEKCNESKVCHMGVENDGSNTAICNNVIVAPPHNKWIQSLLDIMYLYDPDIAKPGTDKWAYYSVQAPMRLFKAKSVELSRHFSVEPPSTFQPIYLDYTGREDLFLLNKSEEILNDETIYELHLWETANKSTLKYISKRALTEGNFTYARIMRYIESKLKGY